MNSNFRQDPRAAAWEVLIRMDVRELPVRVIYLCSALGIDVRYDDSLTEGVDGKTVMHAGGPIIFLDPLATPARNKFTTAHELGHILLGHVGEYRLVYRTRAPRENPIEQAANAFASCLLAPACVLWGCGAQTERDIMRLCGISREDARHRMAQIKERYQENQFLTSPLERKVYEQFLPFIEAHRC